jgi:hypothetical protein
MKLSIADSHRALDIVEDAGGAEASIVAQFALDLAATVPFAIIAPDEAKRLLHARIARHRATLHPVNASIH